jgi:hypothetical protein
MGATAAHAATIYDGSLTTKQIPSQQGWLYNATANPSPPSITATGNGISFDTGSSSNYAGLFKRSPVLLDRNVGYTISFSLKLNSATQTHDPTNRVSLIVMSNLLPGETQPYGIELSFWDNSIWAQDVGFIPSEGIAFNTAAAVRSYVLKIQGNQYQLLTSNLAPPIMQGSLRQYPGFILPAAYQLNPYTTPNLVFIGDNTPAASSNMTITRVSASQIVQVQ